MILHNALLVAVVFFPISEIAIALVKRGAGQATTALDEGSMRLLWTVIGVAVVLAVMLSGYRATRLPFRPAIRDVIALILLLGGLALRWAAIITLGRFFTANVAIHAGQPVISAGPYRFVRHPSYTGLLLAFAGLGVYFGNWLSLAVLIVPIAGAVMRRIAVEESALIASLGPAYTAYCAHRKRLIPRIY